MATKPPTAADLLQEDIDALAEAVLAVKEVAMKSTDLPGAPYTVPASATRAPAGTSAKVADKRGLAGRKC